MNSHEPPRVPGGGENAQQWHHHEISDAFLDLDVTDAVAQADKFALIARYWADGLSAFERTVGTALASAWSGVGAGAAATALGNYVARARDLTVALEEIPAVVRAAAEAIVATKYAIPATVPEPEEPAWSAGRPEPGRAASAALAEARTAMHERYVVPFGELSGRIPLLPMPASWSDPDGSAFGDRRSILVPGDSMNRTGASGSQPALAIGIGTGAGAVETSTISTHTQFETRDAQANRSETAASAAGISAGILGPDRPDSATATATATGTAKGTGTDAGTGTGTGTGGSSKTDEPMSIGSDADSATFAGDDEGDTKSADDDASETTAAGSDADDTTSASGDASDATAAASGDVSDATSADKESDDTKSASGHTDSTTSADSGASETTPADMEADDTKSDCGRTDGTASADRDAGDTTSISGYTASTNTQPGDITSASGDAGDPTSAGGDTGYTMFTGGGAQEAPVVEPVTASATAAATASSPGLWSAASGSSPGAVGGVPAWSAPSLSPAPVPALVGEPMVSGVDHGGKTHPVPDSTGSAGISPGVGARAAFGARYEVPGHLAPVQPGAGRSVPGSAGPVIGAENSARPGSARPADRHVHYPVGPGTPLAPGAEGEHRVPHYLITRANTEELLGTARPAIAGGVIGGEAAAEEQQAGATRDRLSCR